MSTPADHAAAILDWLGANRLAQVERGLADPIQVAPLLTHADAIADAADSDDEAARAAGLGALFGGLVEPLNDGFTPAGRAVYARVFARIAWRVAARDARLGDRLRTFAVGDEAALLARYQGLRRATTVTPDGAKRVVVLSRVTIGADILLTSTVLVRLRQRYPGAELVLLGDGKLAGLFAGLPRVRVRPLAYGRRGALRERLASWLTVADAIADEAPDLVIAPDSRLDQLGVLPVTADPARTLLWENTQPEGHAVRSLGELLDDWLVARLGMVWGRRALPALGLDAAAARARAIFAAAIGPAPIAAVKLDHGGNAAKALPRAAEVAILRALRAKGWRILLDRGFGSDELANSDALIAALGWTAIDVDDSGKELGLAVSALTPGQLADAPVARFHGSIAGWAGGVAACRLALSYDSVGHHLAAALGVPVVVAFTGYADPGFPTAWQPRGPAGVTVVAIPTELKEDPAQWERVVQAIPVSPGRA